MAGALDYIEKTEDGEPDEYGNCQSRTTFASASVDRFNSCPGERSVNAPDPRPGNSYWIAPRPHEWILLALGIVLVLRYRWLIDDSFIYFRYIDNLLFLRTGLVFNRGEYVEGFSSPMHVLVLIPLRALELDWFDIITGLGVACFIAFALLLVRLNRELSPRGPLFNLPLVTLAAGYGTTSYFTSGLETPLVHLAAVALALRLVAPRGLVLTAMVASAPLVRPELAIAVVLTVLFCWWRERRLPWGLVSMTVVANGIWLAFRVYYYAEFFPNTFYLKDGSRWRHGWQYLLDLLQGAPVLPIAAALAGLWLLARLRGDRGGGPRDTIRAVPGAPASRLAMLVISASLGLYVVRIGGAELHYWYLASAFTLLVCASSGTVESNLDRLLSGGQTTNWVGVAAVAVALAVAAWMPPQLSAHPFFGGERTRRIGAVSDASYHRNHPSLRPESWRGRVRIDHMRAFAPWLARDGYGKVVTGAWCRYHWAQFRSRVVHGFGLTDPILARVRTGSLIPGHKPGLIQLAEDLAQLRRAGEVRPGLAGAAVMKGTAPEWIAANLPTIEVLERKMGNRHEWLDNLALALTFPPRIVLPASYGSAHEVDWFDYDDADPPAAKP